VARSGEVEYYSLQDIDEAASRSGLIGGLAIVPRSAGFGLPGLEPDDIAGNQVFRCQNAGKAGGKAF